MNVVMILAGLLACLLLNTFPSASRGQWYEDSTYVVWPERSNWAYSYGDSAGFTPASLFVQTRKVRNQNLDKCKRRFEFRRMFFSTSGKLR